MYLMRYSIELCMGALVDCNSIDKFSLVDIQCY